MAVKSPSLNPISQRYPFELDHLPPEVQQAHRFAFNGLVDLNQAIAALKTTVTSIQTQVTQKATTTSTTATGGVTQPQAVQIANTQAAAVIASTFGSVNNQSGNTSYTNQSGDYGGLVLLNNAAPVAVTLNPVLPGQYFTSFLNLGTGTATLTPGTGVAGTGTINGNASLSLTTGSAAVVYKNQTDINWSAITIPAPVAGGGVTSLDGITGAITLVAGAGITITDNSPAAGNITIASTSAGAILTGNGSIVMGAIGSYSTASVTVTGATTAMPAWVTLRPGVYTPSTGFTFPMTAWVTSANTVTVQAFNDAPSGTPPTVQITVLVFT